MGQLEKEKQIQDFIEREQKIVSQNADRSFRYLLMIEWVFGIVTALFISPKTWSGQMSEVHLHLWSSILLGGIIVSFPIILTYIRPGSKASMYAISSGQMLFGALLIHLMGGRIEAHFYIFGTLAFLATYRRWDVLIPATVIIAIDHIIRGIYWPQSVYGVLTGQEWRFLEHAAWVLFEDAFLVVSIIQGQKDMRRIATTSIELKDLQQGLQRKVEERTSEYLKAKEVAEEALEVKAKFLANMSHEIRTPMNAVLSCTSLLQDNLKNSENIELVSILKKSGDNLLNIIDDILDFSKMEAGVLKLEFKRIDIEEIVKDVFHLMSGKASLLGININYKNTSSSIPLLMGDEYRLKQVLINLVNNALKFSSKKVDILYESKKINGFFEVSISVIDDGIGISNKNQEVLFKEFSQVDASTTRKFGGTGLGLSICKGIVDTMGGEIGLQSEEGKGACFYFKVKLKPAPINESLKEPETSLIDENFAQKHPLKILLAEDNQVNQVVAKKLLSKLGYQIDIVNNGKEAIEKIEELHYDVILMDQHMPEMDGVEATIAIRKKKIKQPYIIAVTASVLEEDKQKCFQAGMDHFIEKPIKLNYLAKILNSLNS